MKSKKIALSINGFVTLGVLLFLMLYGYSATLYPGGSQASIDTIGYDWIHNYWCNLMSKHAINGQVNPARPYAIVAMWQLCLSCALFFIQFAALLVKSQIWKNCIRISSVLSMLFGALMFTDYHDGLIVVASLFGLIAVIGVIRELHEKSLGIYNKMAVICLILLAINNVIYYSNIGIAWLPLLQKITFLVVLIWILGVNHMIRKQIRLWSS